MIATTMMIPTYMQLLMQVMQQWQQMLDSWFVRLGCWVHSCVQTLLCRCLVLAVTAPLYQHDLRVAGWLASYCLCGAADSV